MSTVLRDEPLTISIGSYTATFCPRVGKLGVSGETILHLVREKLSPARGDKLPSGQSEYNSFIKLAGRCWEGRKLQQWRLARNSENGRSYHGRLTVSGTTYSVHCKKPVDTAADEHFTDEDYKSLPDDLDKHVTLKDERLDITIAGLSAGFVPVVLTADNLTLDHLKIHQLVQVSSATWTHPGRAAGPKMTQQLNDLARELWIDKHVSDWREARKTIEGCEMIYRRDMSSKTIRAFCISPEPVVVDFETLTRKGFIDMDAVVGRRSSEHFTDDDYKPLPEIAANLDFTQMGASAQDFKNALTRMVQTPEDVTYDELEKEVAGHIERAQKEFPKQLQKTHEEFRTGRTAPVSFSRPQYAPFHYTGTPASDDALKQFMQENGMTEQPEVAIEAPWMSDEALQEIKNKNLEIYEEGKKNGMDLEAQVRAGLYGYETGEILVEAPNAYSEFGKAVRQFENTIKNSFGVSFAEVRQQHQDMLKAESKGRRYHAVWESPVDKKLTFAIIGISLLAHIGLLVFNAYRDGVPFWSLL